jgi:hypothetical protein
VQFLTLADKQGATVPLMIGHRVMGTTRAFTGDLAGAVAHYDQSLALDNPAERRLHIGPDNRVTALCFRALALWVLGYPETAFADTDHALKDAREIGQAATLMLALRFASFPHIFCGNYARANALLNELLVLADGKGAFYWKAHGMSDKDLRISVNGSNIFYAFVLIMFGESLCGTRSIR